MRNNSIPVEITDIIQTTDDAVLVQLPSGRTAWVPRMLADFTPGHVILPAWLARRIHQEVCA